MRDVDRFLLNVVYDIPALVFVADPDSGALIYANPRMRRVFGADCLQCRFADLFRGAGGPNCFLSYSQQHTADSADTAAELPPQSEYFDDDSENWYQVLQRPITWIDGSRKFVFVLNEINAQKQLQKELSEAHAALAYKNRELELAAKTDRLTQLYNRHHLDAIVEQEMLRAARYGHPFSVLMVDCDHFKAINDGHGHQIGDRVLVHLARVMSTQVRATDTVGRWGGEEFLAILPETGLASAAEAGDKLRRAIAAHDFPVVGRVSASIGAAELKAGEGSNDLIARADAALYRAKAGGRNRVETLD